MRNNRQPSLNLAAMYLMYQRVAPFCGIFTWRGFSTFNLKIKNRRKLWVSTGRYSSTIARSPRRKAVGNRPIAIGRFPHRQGFGRRRPGNREIETFSVPELPVAFCPFPPSRRVCQNDGDRGNKLSPLPVKNSPQKKGFTPATGGPISRFESDAKSRPSTRKHPGWHP